MNTPELGVRKLVTTSELVYREGGRDVAVPTRIAVAAAIMRNPWAGRGFVEDLSPEINALAPDLGDLLTSALVERMEGDPVEAYGKAAVVGLDGEVEHASALIHTLRFGNVLRSRVGGTSYLPFTNRRAGAGTLVSIPLVHIKDSGTRSHFLTADLHVSDAPAADELLVAIGAASAGRPFARIGDRYEDMTAMGIESPA